MNDSSHCYADWKAPAEDGQLLVWPDAPALLADTRRNFQRLAACEARLQGVPLAELRRRQREWIGHDHAQPLIATGHQTELLHPGVWIKDALIDALARKLGGAAHHLAVDTDAPKHLHVRWPGESIPLTDDEALTAAAWCGLLRPPTPAHLAAIQERFAEASKGWGFESCLGSFLGAMRRLSLESMDLSAALTDSIHQVEWDLGLRLHAMVTSPFWSSAPYLAMVHHIMATAAEFATKYNAALANYRRKHGIQTTARPMPDLRMAADECESPFWLDSLAEGERTRAHVRLRNGRWTLQVAEASSLGMPRRDAAATSAGEDAGGTGASHEVAEASSLGIQRRDAAATWGADAFVFDPHRDAWDAADALEKWLRPRRLRLSPRALTLTTFFRLLLVDQFVHGIGGGRYDQVSDEVMASFLGVEPPAFSVTTATLYFPVAAGQRRINLRPLLQEGRRIRHGLFSDEKRASVQRIAQLPRRSPERLAEFLDMHRRLAAECNGPAQLQWEERFRRAERQSADQRALFDRELFFAVQPADRLRRLIDECRRIVGAG